jgi:hypothetical protein
MGKLNHYLTEIATIFKEEKDRYKAHQKATPVLKEMGADKEVLFDVFRQSLSNNEFINKDRHYPTIAFEIYQDKNVGISGNCFMPVPDRRDDLTVVSIHHHGKLLLTTTAAFGPGYYSAVYKKGFTFNKETMDAHLELEKEYQFHKGGIEFVDADQPHVVFFPTSPSITFAMWAYKDVNNTVQSLKSNPIITKFKEPIRKALKFFGLINKAGINVVEYLDFYPENGKYKVLKDRIKFESGDNQNFLTNVFYVLQTAGFNDFKFLQELKQKHPGNTHLHTLIDKLENNIPIQDSFYEFHKNVKYVNFTKSEIDAATHNTIPA